MSYIGWALTILAAGLGSFLGAYLRKKGENLATHEDIDKLVYQVRAVTTATKQIEARISSDLWDRQKRWELKKEVLLLAVKRLAEVNEALQSYSIARRAEHNPEDQAWVRDVYEAAKRWEKALVEFEESRILADMVCDKQTEEAFFAITHFTNNIAVKIGEDDPAFYDRSVAELLKRFSTTRAAIRRELGIDTSPSPQSTASS
jgi:hypothetical protein